MTPAIWTATRLWTTAGWTMLHFMWVGAAVGLFAAIGLALLRRAAAPTRYLFALVCLVLLSAAPVGLAVRVADSLPPSPVFPSESVALPETSRGVPGDAGLAVTVLDASGELPPWENRAVDRRLPDNTDRPRWWEALWLSAMTRWLDVAARILPALWLCGVPLTFSLLATGLVGAERLRRAAEPIRDPALLELNDRLRRSLAVSRRVIVGVCDRLASPILIGIVRPVILFPPALLSSLSPDQIELILLHELAHVRRWDNLVNLLQRTLESLLFFHPVVWWISGVVRREREHCCDDIVVSASGRRESYAATLAQLATAPSMRLAGLTAVETAQAITGSPLGEHQVTSRIRRILKRETEPMQVSRTTLVAAPLCLLAIVATVIAYANSSPGYTKVGQDIGGEGDVGQDIGEEVDTVVQATGAVAPAVKNDSAVVGEVAGTTGESVDSQTGRADHEAAVEHLQQQLKRLAAETEAGAPAAEQEPDAPRVRRSDYHPGTVEFVDRVTLGSGRAGILSFMNVKVGDRVKAGQALAGLQEDDLRAAEIDLQAAEIERESAQRGLQHAQRANDEASGVISEIEMGRLELKLRLAALQVEKHAQRLENLKRQVAAPIDGMVTRVHKRAGEPVNQGEPIVEIVNLNRVRITTHLPSDIASRLEIGRRVTFRTPPAHRRRAGERRQLSHEQQTYQVDDWLEGVVTQAGVVSYISPFIHPARRDTSNGTIEVYIDAKNPNERLRSGMTVNVDFGLEEE